MKTLCFVTSLTSRTGMKKLKLFSSSLKIVLAHQLPVNPQQVPLTISTESFLQLQIKPNLFIITFLLRNVCNNFSKSENFSKDSNQLSKKLSQNQLKKISLLQATLNKDTTSSKESMFLIPQNKDKKSCQLLKRNSTTKLILLKTSSLKN